jgi:hypothetical protein
MLIDEGVPLDKPTDGYWQELREMKGELVVTRGDMAVIRPDEPTQMLDRMHIADR